MTQGGGPGLGSGSSPVWQSTQEALATFVDGGECIVYSASSGRTLSLDPASTLVFDLLRAEARSTAALAEAIAVRWGVDAGAIDPDALAGTLRDLEDAELIQRVSM